MWTMIIFCTGLTIGNVSYIPGFSTKEQCDAARRVVQPMVDRYTFQTFCVEKTGDK